MGGGLDTYRRMDLCGKSQVDLILQVYDGAIAAFRSAGKFYQAEDYQSGYEQLEKAKKFVTHLYTTLDSEAGGEIAEKLSKLYAFIISQTNMAEATKDLHVIDDNITILDNVRLGWLELKQQVAKTAQPSKQSQPASGKERIITLA